MSEHITATPVPWHADPPYAGTHRDNTDGAMTRNYRRASHALAYNVGGHVARHVVGYVR